MSKIFQCLWKKLGMSGTNATFSMEAYKTNVLIRRMLLTSSMEHKIRGYWECVQHCSKVGNGAWRRDSECEMLGIFITVLGEISIISWSSDQMDKSVSMLIPLYVLDRDTPEATERWEGQVEGLRLYSQWVSMEKQLNSSGQNSYYFHHCLFFKKSSKTWRNGRSSQRSSRTGSSSCQCSMTLSGTRMMRIVFRMPKKSSITQWDSRKDIGHSWVQGRKRSGMEAPLTLKKSNGIVQPKKWSNDSKKLVILYLKVSVPWVVESWSKRNVKHRFTSTEILWTQNSCSKQFIL